MRWAGLALALGAAACAPAGVIEVRVDLDGRVAPDDVDLVRLTLSQEGESIGRNVEVPEGASAVTVELVLGPRLRGVVELQATAYRDNQAVGSAMPQQLDLDAPPTTVVITVPSTT